ncbi:MAG: stage V sporulation protein AD [Oscillospiraceae bacterium]|nr:stage V sporulation protein AD [Oscillospiraceae bacterium]
MAVKTGKHTYLLENTPSVLSFAAIGSKKEGQGPLGQYFDQIERDSFFGQSSWEKAESRMVQMTAQKAMEKAGLQPEEVEVAFAGDLLNQCIATTFGFRQLGIPFLGLYGACSTMAESLMMASLFVDTQITQTALACTGSHFCTAERQFRFPLEYGGQRPPTSQWTVTGSGACLVGRSETAPFVRAVTVGTIEDLGICDANNMGAAMAPAAAATIGRFLTDTGTRPEDYDMILTGDLGQVGSALLAQLLEKEKIDLAGRHQDCGLLIYDRATQDVHAGGSGCGCAASVLCSFILPKIRQGVLQDVLFVATGALMSPTSSMQGESIPGIAHLVHLSASRRRKGVD